LGDSAATLPQSNDDGVLHRVEPVYPEEARSRGIEGAVVADVFIDRDGKVVDVKTVSGDPLLAQAVSDAVKQWVFKPRSAPMETRVTLNFSLAALRGKLRNCMHRRSAAKFVAAQANSRFLDFARSSASQMILLRSE